MVKILGSVMFISAVVLLTAGCAGAPESAPSPERGEQEVYFGEGRSESLARAMSAAKMDAVRNAVIDMIGPDREEQNRQTLEEELYNSRNPNLFVYPETMETLRNENVGSVEQLDFVYEVRIRVNRPAIETVLRQAGVTGGGATAEENAGDRAE
ncbi:MAG: hypothetical protein ACOCWS_00440, partial [Alkalispirochaetaceae bacterium]